MSPVTLDRARYGYGTAGGRVRGGFDPVRKSPSMLALGRFPPMFPAMKRCGAAFRAGGFSPDNRRSHDETWISKPVSRGSPASEFNRVTAHEAADVVA